jgi:hypothetical protein
VEKLGYKSLRLEAPEVDQLINLYQTGQSIHDILSRLGLSQNHQPNNQIGFFRTVTVLNFNPRFGETLEELV